MEAITEKKPFFDTLEHLFWGAEGHQVTLEEIIQGRSFIGGKWQDVEFSPELKEAAFRACIEIIKGRKETREKMLYALKWGGKLSHWGLRRFFVVKYSHDSPARFTYCYGQDRFSEMRSIRAYLTGK